LAELFSQEDGALVARFGGETLRIEPWGASALRVRSSFNAPLRHDTVSALLPPPQVEADIVMARRSARISIGAIAAELELLAVHGGDPGRDLRIRFVRADTGDELLAETRPHFAGPPPRYFKSVGGRSSRLEAQFRAYNGERLYGMGQAQHGLLDLKGAVVELVQRNGHVTVPFCLSNRGYGLLWNNPAVGRAEFGRNVTRWIADATPQLDYWITAGNTPADILAAYADATGHAPAFPEWATGFWQSRLRYASQEQLLATAREHVGRGLPLSCIVIDFFHWTRQGEFRFDPVAWPDPAGLVRELAAMGVKTMVSVWPTVTTSAASFRTLRDQGWLVGAERGTPVFLPFVDADPPGPVYVHYYDATHPEARAWLWSQLKANYLAHGINNFWLDACEPEMHPTHPENVRYHAGNGAEVGNAYPVLHEGGVREGLIAEDAAGDAMLLCRSTWAGGQRHGVLLWSGDISSTFEALRAQVSAGLNAGLAGIGWWTNDIGGFYGGQTAAPHMRELIVRWFQCGVFLPVTRLHGFRVPDAVPVQAEGATPSYGSDILSLFVRGGGENEVWSYGEEVEAILTDLLQLRERLRPYVAELFDAFSRTGAPVIRPLFFDFPQDEAAWTVEDSWMFGPDVLVAPVLAAGERRRRVYLPLGATWTDAWTREVHPGGMWTDTAAPLHRIPVFLRHGARADCFGAAGAQPF
jgi:alpha-D-xyloside xylohydrolase